MKHIATCALFALAVAGLATGSGAIAKTERPISVAAVETLTTIPSTGVSANRWLKQTVYDESGDKIGEVVDLVVSDARTVDAAIVSVGGFVGINEKHVAVPISAIVATEKNGKWRLTMNTTKEALKSAPGFKYDKSLETWTAG